MALATGLAKKSEPIMKLLQQTKGVLEKGSQQIFKDLLANFKASLMCEVQEFKDRCSKSGGCLKYSFCLHRRCPLTPPGYQWRMDDDVEGLSRAGAARLVRMSRYRWYRWLATRCLLHASMQQEQTRDRQDRHQCRCEADEHVGDNVRQMPCGFKGSDRRFGLW